MKKTAIITGSSRGIGYEIAKQLGLDGFQIVIVATSPFEKNAENMEWFSANSIPYFYIQANLGDTTDRKRIISETVEHFGAIHVLVNNAGVAPLQRADLLEMSEESFERVVGINTKGTMFLTQEAAKQMITQDIPEGEKKRGTIVNISSASAVVSSINRGEYCVSKAGMSMLTLLYADRLAPENILVHEVRPGVIATDMTSTVTEKYTKLINDGAFPIARWGQAEEVAGAVSALCSDKFTYTTGNYIDVDGGFHIKRL